MPYVNDRIQGRIWVDDPAGQPLTEAPFVGGQYANQPGALNTVDRGSVARSSAAAGTGMPTLTTRAASDEGGGSPWPGAGIGQLTIRNPKTGETRVIDSGDYKGADALTRAGWVPVNTQGHDYGVADYQGGQMFVDPDRGQSLALNALLGGQMSPEQNAAMSDFMSTPEYAKAYKSAVGGLSDGSGGGGTGGTDNVDFGNLFNLQDIPQIPRIDLGQMPTVSGQFSPEFMKDYWGQVGNVEGEVDKNYWEAVNNLPTMQAAQTDLSQVPQPKAQQIAPAPQVDQSEALKFLLSGQGFDPKTVALMKGTAGDAVANQARTARSSAKLDLERAGLGQSGADVALMGQIDRRAGDARTQAERDIDIQNALQGIQNLTTGAGMEQARTTGNADRTNTVNMNNAQQANLMALQNASNMLQAMQANTQNTQQANFTNNQNKAGLIGEGAAAKSNVVSSAGQNLATSQTAKAAGADEQNAANAFNWRLNQANLDTNRNMFNVGTGENRWGSSVSGLINLANGTQAPAFYNQGTQLTGSVTPNNTWGALLRGAGNSLLDSANRRSGA